MLERAKERTAAEFGVVQAVLQRPAALPLPSAKANLRRGSAPLPALTKQGLGLCFTSGMLCRVQFGWNRGVWICMLHPVYGQEWDGAFLFTQRSVYQ